MNIPPDLSICVATTTNRPEILERFLSSVSLMDEHLSLEIIVVDRYSLEKSSLEIIKEFRSVNLIEIDSDCSLATAFEEAMTSCNGRYISLWKDGITVEDDSLVRLVEFLDEHPDVGVVAPEMKNDKEEVVPAARAFPALWDLVVSDSVPGGTMPGRNEDGGGESEWLLGPPLAINRCLFEEIGGVSGRFPYYWQLEYCLRAARVGWHMHYCKDIRVKGSAGSLLDKGHVSGFSLLQEKIAVAIMIVSQRLRA